MTHDDEVFIEIANRIRERHMEFENITLAESFMPRMANRIEELSAENERLREALLQMKRIPNYIRKDDNRKEMLKIINAALGDTK